MHYGRTIVLSSTIALKHSSFSSIPFGRCRMNEFTHHRCEMNVCDFVPAIKIDIKWETANRLDGIQLLFNSKTGEREFMRIVIYIFICKLVHATQQIWFCSFFSCLATQFVQNVWNIHLSSECECVYKNIGTRMSTGETGMEIVEYLCEDRWLMLWWSKQVNEPHMHTLTHIWRVVLADCMKIFKRESRQRVLMLTTIVVVGRRHCCCCCCCRRFAALIN